LRRPDSVFTIQPCHMPALSWNYQPQLETCEHCIKKSAIKGELLGYWINLEY
jgi:hypothetical protein